MMVFATVIYIDIIRQGLIINGFTTRPLGPAFKIAFVMTRISVTCALQSTYWQNKTLS